MSLYLPLYKILRGLYTQYKKMYNRNNQIKLKSKLVRIKSDIIGQDNEIKVGENCLIDNLQISIRGNNNKIIIKEKCNIGPDCIMLIEGSNCLIEIGAYVSMTRLIRLICQENNRKIIIREDCMLANNIVLRTSDSHPIFICGSKDRINNPEDIIIGKHVWIAPNTKIMKGAKIGGGSIVGSDTTITREYPNNTLIIGRPAKIIKTDIEWTREKLF